MESVASAGAVAGVKPGSKGLKRNAISFLENVVIGVSSTSPAYSLAASLGLVAAAAAFATPAVMIVAFIPMLFIACAFYHMNRADPDCGTTFSWVTRAIGPRTGWIGGWSIIVAGIMVLPSLATIAGKYSFQLLGINDPSTAAVTLAGVAWIAVMTAICYRGIELSARTQLVLLGTQLAILVIWAVVAIAKVYAGSAPPASHPPSFSWFNPFAIDSWNKFAETVVLAVFIYWGWDTTVSLNEETEDPGTTPGRAAVVSTIVLVAVYVLVAVAAVAFAGPDLLAKNSSDVFAAIGAGVLGPLDKLLVLAVLTSALASTQTTILPSTRMAVSMASAGAIPKRFGAIHPRYLSPGFATVAMGAIASLWYVGLTIVSENVLADSILALGLIIAFYYGLTGLACVVFYRRELFDSAASFLLRGVFPAAGAAIMFALFIQFCISLGPTTAGSTSVFGIGGPLVISVGALLAGFLLMAVAHARLPDFFRRKPQAADGGIG